MKDFLTAAELSPEATADLFARAARLKKDPASDARALAGRSVVLIFEKPSLRTRLTFEVGIARLGGHPVYYDHSKERIGERESIHDYARNLERWVDAVVARTFSHETIADLARHSRVPVINALSDHFHPCQALADLFTLHERLGPLKARRLAYIGDGNNVCCSLMLLASTMGMHLTVITPEKHRPAEDIVRRARAAAEQQGGSLDLSSDPARVRGAAAVYTDAWTSMGWEAEAQQRRRTFARYQVNPDLMAIAGDHALFMHCLPAHRGEEVTDDVIDSPRSIVFDQAENRMHAQNALLVTLLGRTA
jgi:ornithine carbamoyltransferase